MTWCKVVFSFSGGAKCGFADDRGNDAVLRKVAFDDVDGRSEDDVPNNL